MCVCVCVFNGEGEKVGKASKIYAKMDEEREREDSKLFVNV